ncbi:MAG: flavodoxin [Clostridia bacterium]|nr:flavodoxin [Clostridia bacterium]
MNTIVVYYSLEGNTDFAAGRIAAALGADTLRLYPCKAYPDRGFRKFFWGGKSAVMAETPALEPYRFDRTAYDRVILGFPVWAARPAPPIRTFVKDNDLTDLHIAAFACQSGSGAEKAFAKLQACLPADRLEATLILTDPKSKPDEQNERNIRAFCAALDGTPA